SYSTKFASALYGPFREAADSGFSFGDRSTYQMNPANGREAFRESLLDMEEGADILMVKPASFYLDVLAQVRELGLPTAAYQVSGEYSMIKAAAQNGWIDEKRIVMESLTSIKRAGADLIITYYAQDVARWLA
ncbi:MAG TPA: porphobilinogen synthase, partial [Methanocorpusculum sp.]|nr:porphobilinogen synthase [Methanocorpusculum sp.]